MPVTNSRKQAASPRPGWATASGRPISTRLMRVGLRGNYSPTRRFKPRPQPGGMSCRHWEALGLPHVLSKQLSAMASSWYNGPRDEEHRRTRGHQRPVALRRAHLPQRRRQRLHPPTAGPPARRRARPAPDRLHARRRPGPAGQPGRAPQPPAGTPAPTAPHPLGAGRAAAAGPPAQLDLLHGTVNVNPAVRPAPAWSPSTT